MATNDFECQDWMTKIQDVLNRKAKVIFPRGKKFLMFLFNRVLKNRNVL